MANIVSVFFDVENDNPHQSLFGTREKLINLKSEIKFPLHHLLLSQTRASSHKSPQIIATT